MLGLKLNHVSKRGHRSLLVQAMVWHQMGAQPPPDMMTSSNGNIFRVTGHLCGEFPAQRPVTRNFDVFFDLRLNKRLSKQSWGWWFETLSRPLLRHCNGTTAGLLTIQHSDMHITKVVRTRVYKLVNADLEIDLTKFDFPSGNQRVKLDKFADKHNITLFSIVNKSNSIPSSWRMQQWS